MTTTEKLTDLMIKVSEVSVDVKHLLARQSETGERIDRLEDRTNIRVDEVDERLRTVEKMRGKLLGIAFVLPLVITIAVAAVGRIYG